MDCQPAARAGCESLIHRARLAALALKWLLASRAFDVAAIHARILVLRLSRVRILTRRFGVVAEYGNGAEAKATSSGGYGAEQHACDHRPKKHSQRFHAHLPCV